MALNRSDFHAWRPDKSCRLVIDSHSARIEPVLKCCARAIVWKHSAIPEAFQRRYLVIAGASPGLESKARVSAHHHWQDVVGFLVVLRDPESLYRRKLVVGIQRWHVTRRAAFALKHPLPSFRNSVKLVRIRRRLEGVQVQGQGVKLCVTVPAPCRRIWQSLEPWRV